MKSFGIFLTIVLGVWTLMHWYVFWRLSTVPWLSQSIPRVAWIWGPIALWVTYPASRIFQARGWDALGLPLEWIGTTWIGLLFLLLAFLLAADVLTLGGLLFPRASSAVRLSAAGMALLLGVVAVTQGQQAPTIREYEVTLPGLAKQHDGLVIVAASDLHLGTMIHRDWLRQFVKQVEAQRPDLVVLVGDIIDGDVKRVEELAPELKRLRAPLGVWAVTGNHDYYAGVEASVRWLEGAGIHVLRDANTRVAPGLVLAGIDDLTARRDRDRVPDPVQKAMRDRAAGGSVLLSHTPLSPGEAAKSGAGLIISGHTHHGQIWPFSYLVRLKFQHIGGRYEVAGTTAIVSRGAGTWGPRMRLWYPSEIVRVVLRAEEPGSSSTNQRACNGDERSA